LIDINLTPIPNQSVSVKLEESLYTLVVKETRGVMSFDLIRDNVPVLLGSRMLPNSPLVPYRYLEAGNFVMVCDDDEYPDYRLFGDTQSLVYVTAAELEVLRA
jgi:hypothetical protein